MEPGQDLVVAFDWDGTCTELDLDSDEAFFVAHQTGFAELAGRPVEWVREQYAAARALILGDPDAHGWVRDGHIVAPATVDVFVFARVCAQFVLGQMGERIDAWDARLNALYQEHYLLSQATIRPELLEVFRTLRDRSTPFYIVTNSDPNKVRTRLGPLGDDADWIRPLVHGNAQKYVVTSGPDCVPMSTRFPGLRRSVLLRKEHYYNVLVSLMRRHNIPWSKLRVVGDLAELDLAMPVMMNAQGCLMTGPNTPAYERQWAQEHPRVRLITNLREAIA